MPITSFFQLVFLAAIWGSSFLFMRMTSAELGPVLLMALRTLIATLTLLPILFLYKQWNEFNGKWRDLFVVGMLNTAIPFVMFGYATLHLTAGLTSVLNATTPFFGVIIAFIWFKEKLSIGQALGLLLGFTGVYLLMLDKINAEDDSAVLLPSLAVFLATFCYALSASYTKRHLTGVKPLAQATGSQICATLVLVPLSVFFLPETLPSDTAIYAVIVLGMLCTAIAYIIFFKLIADIGPTNAISVTYLIPVFGIFWGALFLSEQVTMLMLIGGITVLFGVALTTSLIKLRNKKAAS